MPEYRHRGVLGVELDRRVVGVLVLVEEVRYCQTVSDGQRDDDGREREGKRPWRRPRAVRRTSPTSPTAALDRCRSERADRSLRDEFAVTNAVAKTHRPQCR